MIEIRSIQDFLYCPELYWRKKNVGHSSKLYELGPIKERRAKRKELRDKYSYLERTYEEYYGNKKKGKGKKVHTESHGLGKWIHRCRKDRLKKKLDPQILLREEQVQNPGLNLVGHHQLPSVYAQFPKIIVDADGLLTIHLDRQSVKSPTYLGEAYFRDIMLVTGYLSILIDNFFVTDAKGVIHYENTTKTYKWSDPRISKKCIDELQKKILPYIGKGSRKSVNPHPSRCHYCEIATTCENKRELPWYLYKSKMKQEEVEIVYRDFKREVQTLYMTNMTRFEHHLARLLKIITSSKWIYDPLYKHCKKKKVYDVEEVVRSAILHKKKLFNRWLPPSEDITFGFQLLMYLSQKGKVSQVKQLLKGYGKEHEDQMIVKFIIRNLHELIRFIDLHLESLIPKAIAQTIQNEFNIHHSMVNVANDNATINANMHLDSDIDD